MTDEVIENIESQEVPTDATEEPGQAPDDSAGQEVSEDPGGQAHPEGEVAEQATPYQPNLQYKVYDDVREFPEWSHGLVSNEDTEKNLRELLTKADGIDAIKERYGQAKEQLSDVRGEHQKYVNFIQQSQHYANHDLATFLEMHQIPKEKVLQYTRQLLDYDEMSPQERAAMDQQRQQVRDQFNQSQQYQELETRYQQLEERQFQNELRSALSIPQVTEVRKHYDNLYGEGAFLQEVSNYGTAQHARDIEVSPTEAVQYVVGKLSKMVAPPAQQGAQAAAPQQRPHTIPNMGSGRGHAPAKARPKNLDELRKHIKEITADMPG